MIPGNNSEILHPKQLCHLPILYILDDQFCLGELEVCKPSRDIIILSVINSTGVFKLEHL